MHLSEHQVDQRLGVAPTRFEALHEPVEHHEPFRVHRGNRRQAALVDERAQDPRHVGRLVGVLDRPRVEFGLGAGRER